MNAPRILIADDYPAIRQWIRDVLQSSCGPVDIREAANGAEVIRLIRDGAVDLIITDLIMPEKEGIETIQTVRREYPRLPIIAISGTSHPEYLEMALALGATAILQKPLTASELVATVVPLLPPPPAPGP